MPNPTTRDGLIQWCLRRLGHPVIEINVDPDQVEDRIDEALQMYQQFHMDSVEHVLLPYQITSNDITNKYIPIPSDFTSVIGYVPLGNDSKGMGMFDISYQIHLNDWDAFYGNGSVLNYDMTMQKLALLQWEFDVKSSFDYNRHQQRLYVRWNWHGDVVAGQRIVIEGYRALDPATYSDIYNDRWLKLYATELIRLQWGINLMKYSGTSLPGGITLNGTDIYEKATEAMEKLEEDLRNTYELPIDFYMG
jgi:hypothetical protein